MTIQQLKDQFKQNFNKQCLKYIYWGYHHNMYTVENYQPYLDDLDVVNIIFLLDELGYEFKQKEFDTFILALTFGKSNSFMAKDSYRWTTNDYKNKLYDIFFSKFTPSKKQLDTMVNCYLRQKSTYCFSWLSTLVKKDVTLDSKQQKILIKAGCSPSVFFKDEITADKLSEILNNDPNISTSSGMSDFKMLLDKCDLTDDTECVEKVLRYYTYNSNYVYEVVHKMLEQGAKVTTATINTMIDTFGTNLLELYNVLINAGARPDQSTFDLVIKRNIVEIAVLILENGYVKPTVEHINSIISECELNFGFRQGQLPVKNYGNEIKCYQLFQQLNIEPNIDTLRIVCLNGDFESYTDITKNYNMVPDVECLNNALNMARSSKLIVEDILQYKVLPTVNGIKNIASYGIKSDRDKIFELLFRYGFRVDRSILDVTLCLGYEIKRLNRFNLVFNNVFYYLMHKHKFFPEDYIKLLPTKIKELHNKRRMFCTMNIEKLKEMLNNDFVPDKYCLENALFNHNYNVFRELVDRGLVEPTLRCLTDKRDDVLDLLEGKIYGSIDDIAEMMVNP